MLCWKALGDCAGDFLAPFSPNLTTLCVPSQLQTEDVGSSGRSSITVGWLEVVGTTPWRGREVFVKRQGLDALF